MITDKSATIYGISVDSRALEFISKELKNDKDVVKKVLETHTPASWKFVGDDYIYIIKNAFYNHIKDTKESKKLKEDTFPKKVKNICK